MRSSIINLRRIALSVSLALACACFLFCTGCDEGKKPRNEDVSARLESVRVYIELGQYDRADTELSAIESRYPRNADAAYLRKTLDSKYQRKPHPSAVELEAAAKSLIIDPADLSATETLTRGGGDSARYLIPLTESTDVRVRLAAIRLIAQNPTQDATHALLASLTSESPDIVFTAHHGLCTLTGEKVDIVLDQNGLPDGSKLTSIWSRKTASKGLVAAATPQQTPRMVARTPEAERTPRPTSTPRVKPDRTSKPETAPNRSSSPSLSAKPTPQPSSTKVKPSPSPKPSPTPRPSTTPRWARNSETEKPRPGAGGPQSVPK